MGTYFQDNLYQFLSDYLALKSSSPNYLEITKAMGVSPKSKSLITRSLRALKQEGKIKLKKEGRKIIISLTQKSLRLIGKISAGLPIEAIEENHFIDFKECLESKGNFVLQVKGNSMMEDGILNNDFIICKKSNTANEGDVVIALIDQENATLKRLSFKEKGMITLVPSHNEMAPQVYLPERVQIQGIYVGLVRL